jgi:hypothetical protein
MKMTYSEIRDLQDTIPKNGWQAHYVLGAYEVLLASIVADLPKTKQLDAKRALENLASRAKSVATGE